MNNNTTYFFRDFDTDYFLCCCCISGCDGSSDVSVGSCGLYLIRNKCIYCPYNLHEGTVFILSPPYRVPCGFPVLKNCLSGTAVTYLGYSLYVPGKLSTYPYPEPTLTLTSDLEQNIGLGEG